MNPLAVPVYPFVGFFLPGYQPVDGDKLNALFGLVVPVQRSVKTAAQSQIQGTDFILNLNLSAPTIIQLPQASPRGGKPIIFVDAGLQCGSNNVTLQPFSGDTIVNWQNPAALVMNFNGQVVALQPFNDGVNNGWFVPPGVA